MHAKRKIITYSNPNRVIIEPTKQTTEHKPVTNRTANSKIVTKDADTALLEQDSKTIDSKPTHVKRNVETNKSTDKGKQSMLTRTGNQTSEHEHVTAAELTDMIELDNLGLNDDYFDSFKPINIGATLFPLNTPCTFVGQKGSGKTYLLASVVQYAYRNKLIKRLFYIYAENIDTTLSRAIPKKFMYAIPKTIASQFLIKFLRKKTKFTSCFNFIESYKHLNGKHKMDEKIDNIPIYWDNLLDSISKNKRLQLLGQMIKYAERVVNKYMRGTQLTFNGKYHYNLGRFSVDDFDMIILDDIAQFQDLFGERRNKSELYPYFTITRQNKTTFYLTAQEVKQLPKMFREMLGAIVLLNGTNMNDIDELKLDRDVINLFKQEFLTLKNHEGILYNFNDKEFEIIKK